MAGTGAAGPGLGLGGDSPDAAISLIGKYNNSKQIYSFRDLSIFILNTTINICTFLDTMCGYDYGIKVGADDVYYSSFDHIGEYQIS